MAGVGHQSPNMSKRLHSPFHSQSGLRRKQFSSCDLCRKSRVACDSSQLLQVQLQDCETPGSEDRGHVASHRDIRCSNCLKRSVECTYEWMRDTSDTRTRRGKSRISSGSGTTSRNQDTAALVYRSPQSDVASSYRHDSAPADPYDLQSKDGWNGVSIISSLGSTSELSRQAEAIQLQTQLWEAFSRIFEPVFGLWIGSDCNPYKISPQVSSIKITRLVSTLDQWSCKCWIGRNSPKKATIAAQPHRCIANDPIVNDALIAVVNSFSLRWLPLFVGKPIDDRQLTRLGLELWENSRTKILRIIDRPSYKSIIALYLFGLTPVLPGQEDVESSGIIGELSVDIALRHFHTMRLKRRNPKFSGTNITQQDSSDSDWVDNEPRYSDEFIQAEARMYWAGTVIDTSASLTRSRPPILCSGILGFEEEPVFRLVKAYTQVFHEESKDWRAGGFIATDERVLLIVHRASTWKGYVWKMVALLREAINYGHEEVVIARAHELVLGGLAQFEETYKPLLAVCENNMLFLGKEAQLCYYLLQLHYNMGLLLLCDTVETTGRKSLVSDFEKIRREAVHAIFSAVNFGLTCQVSLDQPSHSGTHGDFVSLISLDPYPHHVVASLKLAVDALLGYLAAGSMMLVAIHNPCKIALRAIEMVPQCSASVQVAKSDLREKLKVMERGLSADNEQVSQAVLDDLLKFYGICGITETTSLGIADDELTGDSIMVSASDINLAGRQFLHETVFGGNAF